jgi:hypothetical protein
MRWCFATLVLIVTSVVSLRAETQKAQSCLPQMEFAPIVVVNPGNKVTFRCGQATPLELIRATGYQTRIPIGLVLGRDRNALSKIKHSYNLQGVDAMAALREATKGTGYSLKEENHVFILRAGDVTPRQQQILGFQYSDFKPGTDQTMVALGETLTMWMRALLDPKTGFAMEILSSTNEERFSVSIPQGATTEEIANRIVILGSRGMWILRASATSPSGSLTDRVEIEPYQHYSNSVIPCQ